MVMGTAVVEPVMAGFSERNVAVKEYVRSSVGTQTMLAVAPVVPDGVVDAWPMNVPSVAKNCTPPLTRMSGADVLIETLRRLAVPMVAVVGVVQLMEEE
jgi:hypothetical protein